MTAADELPPFSSSSEAVREVAWIARRARELALSGGPPAPAPEYVEFFARKVRLLRHIAGTSDPGSAEARALIAPNLELLRYYEEQTG